MWQTLSKTRTGGGHSGFHMCVSWALNWSCKTWVVGTTGNWYDCRKAWGWDAGASEVGTQCWMDRHTSSATSASFTFMISLCLCHGWCSKAVVLTQGRFWHVWGHLWLSRGGGNATGIELGEARAAAQHPTVPRMAPITKND